MDKETLTQIVQDAYIVATIENGYDLDAMTSEEVACDMADGVADLEEVDVQEIEEAVKSYRGY